MLERMSNLDRRWIFLTIAVVVATPLIFGWVLPLGTASPRTLAIYNYIQSCKPGGAIMICFDYGPSSMPELQPMAIALIHHCLTRHLRVITLTLDPAGVIVSQDALREAAKGTRAKETVDWVNLGYQPGYQAVVLKMGTDIQKVFTNDVNGKVVATMPVMAGIHTYTDVKLVIDLTSTNSVPMWVMFAEARFHATLAAGVTGVMATDMYPFLQSKQLIGLLNGLKGAAEYEHLIHHPGLAIKGMTAQSFAHLAIILFVIIGNVGYLASRRRRR